MLHRDIICSRDVTIPFATVLESNGSNFAASNSFATARPMAMPSVIPGGFRMPPESTRPISSFTRLEHRARKEVSNTENDRRTKIVSGLWILSTKPCGNQSNSPLVCLSINSIGVHSNFRKELVDQTEEPWVIRAESRLQERGGCPLSQNRRSQHVCGSVTFRRIFSTFFERKPQRSPERCCRVIFEELWRFVNVNFRKPIH